MAEYILFVKLFKETLVAEYILFVKPFKETVVAVYILFVKPFKEKKIKLIPFVSLFIHRKSLTIISK